MLTDPFTKDQPPVIRPQNRPPILLLIPVIIIIIAILGFYLWQQKTKNQPTPNETPIKQVVQISTQSARLNTFSSQQPIAKVGEELIYKKDLDTELAYYPPDAQVDKNKFLMEKIIEDSIILQGAKADGYISFDPVTFNSLDKDYMKRVKLVEKAKQEIDQQIASIDGSVISIWFFNLQPGALGYEKGKEFAYKKISQIYSEVKSNKLSFTQAGEKIRNDGSLSQVDGAYKANAIFDFANKKKGSAITIERALDTALWNLKTGQVTDIFLAQDWKYENNSKKRIDAVYMFGTVTKRNSNNKETGFEDWLNKKRKVYEVVYY